MTDLPVIITAAGLQPQLPADMNAQLIALAVAAVPGLTANLPGSLIDDVAGTDTGALVLIDQARVDAVNSLTPYGANEFTLLQLGQIYLGQGSQFTPETNTAVYVIFSGTVGFVIGRGFAVSDGTNQYTVQDGGVINTGGSSDPLFCLAVQPGSFAVPANTVTQLVTSVPNVVTLTVTNPLAGTPGGGVQTAADYRAQVLQAGLAASSGMTRYLKTLLSEVPGVQPRLTSVRAQTGGGWEVIVGGTGDAYAIGRAILYGLFDISTLVGSVIHVVALTNANPGVITTDLNHGYITGQVITITGVVGTSGVNGSRTITVTGPKTFSIGVNTTANGTWTSGGVITPNFRNVTVSLNEYPDTYTVPFVLPPVQAVTMSVTWNTTSVNFVSPTAIAALAQPAIAAYVNSIPVGAPINVFELESTFTQAISGILPHVLLTRMIFSVAINGIVTVPNVGTGIIVGDPESYFSMSATDVTVTQG